MIYQYIAGQTPLDENEKHDLIPSIITREDLDRFEQENIIEARMWVMQESVLSKHHIFTENFLNMLHKRMYGHVWKWAGKYRKSNKNIGVDYYLIPIELRKLLDDVQYWLEYNIYTANHLAIIFHHRLVKIHLFSNGNGRHARLCADAIIAKYNGQTLTWGGSTHLIKPDDIRKHYIAALQEADYGNYAPIIAFSVSDGEMEKID